MPDDLQQPEDGLPKPIPSELEASTADLNEEINILTSQQNEARLRAAYVGMMPDEERQYEARRVKISRLVNRLLSLRRADKSR